MLYIGPVASDAERKACARMMAGSDPWLTLGLTYERALARMGVPGQEIYVIKAGDEVAGFALISMQGIR